MALLDAILCVSDGSSNCYSNLSARSIGIGMVNGVLINWNGTRWHQASNVAQILINDQNSVITELWTTDQTWATIGAPTITGKAPNGLYYDGGQGGSAGGSSGWVYANNYCISKGLRLPFTQESSATSQRGEGGAAGGSPSGVPCVSGVCWSASALWGDTESGYYYSFTSSEIYFGFSTFNNGKGVMCVK